MMKKQTRTIAPAPVHGNSLALRFGKPLRTFEPVELGTSSNDMHAVNPVKSTALPPSRFAGILQLFK